MTESDANTPGDTPVTAAKKSAPRPAAPKSCNAPDCTKSPTVRGLCDPHWATLRGLADPKKG